MASDRPFNFAQGRFVSRGGEKLQAAIENWQLKIKDYVVLDVGSSTGGFVDCLLENGAKKVYALDTAYGELAWKLRNDPKVMIMERTNVLYLQSLPEPLDLITIDAGWTKMELILPVIKKFLKPSGRIIALLKPQYEAEKKLLIKGVLSQDIAEKIKDGVIKKIEDLGFKITDQMESPILGGAGNKEYFLLVK